MPSTFWIHSCAYTIHGAPARSTYSVPSSVMKSRGVTGASSFVSVNGPAGESLTAITVARHRFGRVVSVVVNRCFGLCSVVNSQYFPWYSCTSGAHAPTRGSAQLLSGTTNAMRGPSHVARSLLV